MTSEKTRLAPIRCFVGYQCGTVIVGNILRVFFNYRRQIQADFTILSRLGTPKFRSLTSEQPNLLPHGIPLRTPFVLLDNMLVRSRYHILEAVMNNYCKRGSIPLNYYMQNFSKIRKVPLWAIWCQTDLCTHI